LPKYRLTWFFYNSNLSSQAEYDKRLHYVKLMAKKFHIPLIIVSYDHSSWSEKIKGREGDPERGGRCQICYLGRLRETAKLAKEEKFDYFSTTLLYSPYKDIKSINRLATDLEESFGIKYLLDNFQAQDGYYKSQEFAKEFGIYRQKFCGCEFSVKQKNDKK